MKRFISNIIAVPVVLFLLLATLVLRFCVVAGFGHDLLYKVNRLTEKFSPLRVQEVLVYKFPVPEHFLAGGHIRFIGIRTANAKNEPLDPITQEPCMYMARVNLLSRLEGNNTITVNQLKKELTARRFFAKEVFVFPAGERQKYSTVIKLN